MHSAERADPDNHEHSDHERRNPAARLGLRAHDDTGENRGRAQRPEYIAKDLDTASAADTVSQPAQSPDHTERTAQCGQTRIFAGIPQPPHLRPLRKNADGPCGTTQQIHPQGRGIGAEIGKTGKRKNCSERS